MGKRVAIISVLVLISGLVVMGYFLQRGHRNLFTDPYRAISPEACIVAESADLRSFINSLTTGKGLAGEIGNIREFETFNKKLKYFADQINKPGFNLLMNDGEAVLAFFPSERGSLQPLISVIVAPETRDKHIRSLITASGAGDFIESRAGGRSIFGVPFEIGSERDTIFISLISGLLVGSLSEEILEEAIIQTGRTGDVRDQPGFRRVLLASGKNENKIFLVLPNLGKTIEKLLSPGFQSLATRIASVSGTTGADIYLNEDGLVLSGYTESSDTQGFLSKHKSLPRHTFSTFRLLPASTVMFETEVMTPGQAGAAVRPDAGEELKLMTERLRGLAGSEVTIAYLDIRERPASENLLFIYEVVSSAQAEQLFTELSGRRSEVSYFEPDDQVRIPVYGNPFRGLAGELMPGFTRDFDDSYIAFYNNFMISGSSYLTITRLLYENILNKTLANDLSYREFENSLPSSAGYYFYCVPSRITEWLAPYLDDDLSSSLRTYKGSLAKIQAAGLKMVSSNGMIYNSFSLRFREEAREESTTEWETLLDTLAAVKPFFFTNHNTGAKEIFIQDLKNNAYLINAAGRVLWKVPLRERIMGDIHMIDIYRNGKFQLLFSGRNFLHLLDRNGNYVDRYPVSLRSPATNPMALFDYDNNLNYRIFIAGEDKNIYSYDKNGNTVRGWKPFSTAGMTREEISYFRVSGKDYLVVSDEINLYFLDRSGNIRVTLKEAVKKAPGSALRLTAGAQPSVVCTSTDGTVYHIGFDGSISKFTLKELSFDHRSDFFDIDGDGFGEYVFIDKGMLYLYDHDKKEMFSRDFNTGDLAGPLFFSFSSSDRKIGVTDRAARRIYLIDKNGDTMSGFPLKGASMFSIGKLSEKSGWHLVVGGTDRFLYNYFIDTEVNKQ